MNGLPPVAVAMLAALLTGCSQLTALNSRGDATPGGLAREALERPAPISLRPQPRLPNPGAPEPFRVEVAHSDLWDRLRAGFRLGPGPDEGVAGELAYYSRNSDFVQRALERGRPYLHHIVERLDRRGMPLELALLPVVESAFQPTAYSPAQAAGLWQFIPATGKRFGLAQNRRYDGRRDVIASTEAALDYLSELHARFDGDWPLALAAYNWGERNVERALDANRAAGRPADYWSLSMPRETRAYVPRLLAVARMLAAPERFTLKLEALPNRPYFAAVEVARDVRLVDVARQLGLERAELERLNPGYRQGVTGGGSHTIVVPAPHAPTLLAQMDSLDTANAPAATAEPAPSSARNRYRIRQGDTLGGIAERFGVSVADLRSRNSIKGNAIRAGQHLEIPSSGNVTHVASAGFRGGKRGGLPEARLHTVARGDTLWHVSRRYHVPVDEIAAINGLPRSAVLAPGQKLVVTQAEPTTRTPAEPASARPPNKKAGSATADSNADAAKAESTKTAGAKAESTKTGSAKAESTKAGSATAATKSYLVRAGDSLWSIARRFEVSVDDLCRWNGIGRKTRLAVGRRLMVTTGGTGR